MTLDVAKDIIKNFNAFEWDSSTETTGTYKADLSLHYKVDEFTTNLTDEFTPLDTWSEFFKKYNIIKKTYIRFMYNNNEIDVIPLFANSDIIIPMPVAANMISDFYISEILVAKYLSTDIKSFLTFEGTIKTQEKNF